MPLPSNYKSLPEAEKKRLVQEELARRSESQPEAAPAGLSGLGSYVLDELKAGSAAQLSDMLGAAPLEQMGPLGQAARVAADFTGVGMGRGTMNRGLHALFPNAPRQMDPSAPVVAAAQQALNPFLSGAAGERAMNQQNTTQLAETLGGGDLGHGAVAALQTLSNLGAGVAMRFPGSATIGKIGSLRTALPVIGREFAQGEAVSGLQGFLGSDAGQRASGAWEAMTDPANMALNLVGGGIGTLQGIKNLRADVFPRGAESRPDGYVDPVETPASPLAPKDVPPAPQVVPDDDWGSRNIVVSKTAKRPLGPDDDSRVGARAAMVNPPLWEKQVKLPVPEKISNHVPANLAALAQESQRRWLAGEFGSPELIHANIRALADRLSAEVARVAAAKAAGLPPARVPGEGTQVLPARRKDPPTIMSSAFEPMMFELRRAARLPPKKRWAAMLNVVAKSPLDERGREYVLQNLDKISDPALPQSVVDQHLFSMNALSRADNMRTNVGGPAGLPPGKGRTAQDQMWLDDPVTNPGRAWQDDPTFAGPAPIRARLPDVSAEVEVMGKWEQGPRAPPPAGEVTSAGGTIGERALARAGLSDSVNPYFPGARMNRVVPLTQMEQAGWKKAQKGERVTVMPEVPETTQPEIFPATPARIAAAIQHMEEMDAQGNPAASMDPAPTTKQPLDPGLITPDPTANTLATRSARDPSLMQKLGKFFKVPEDRWNTPQLVADSIRSFNSARRLRDITLEQIHPKLTRALKKLTVDQKYDVDRYIKQNMRPEDVDQKFRVPLESLPSEVQNLFRETFKENDRKRNVLIENGYFTEVQLKYIKEQDAAGRQWLHSDYLSRMVKGWKPPEDKFNRAVAKLQKAGNLDEQTARGYLHQLINGDRGTFNQRLDASPISKQILKGRSKMPWWLRDVLGEISDPAYVVANSAAELDALYHQHKVSEAFLTPDTKGVYWNDTPLDHLAIDPVGGKGMDPLEARRMYGGFAGKYLHPALMEAVSTAPSLHVANEMIGLHHAAMSMFRRAKTIYSPVTFMRNWFGNLSYLAAADVPIYGLRFYKRFGQAAKAMLDYRDAVYGAKVDSGSAAGWVKAALQYGAVLPGRGSDLGGSSARRIAQKVARQTDGTAISAMQLYWDEANGKLGDAYEGMDKHARLMAFIEQSEQGMRKFDLSPEDAYKRASQIVNENFASGANVGKDFRAAGNGLPGMLAPFMSWHADNIRVHGNWLRRGSRAIVNRDPKEAAPLFRLAVHHAIIFGAVGLGRMWAGMSDEEVATADASMKAGYGSRNPFAAVWPWRDNQGRLQLIPLDSLSASATFLRGRDNSDGSIPGRAKNLATRVAANALIGFFDGGSQESTAGKLLAGLGLPYDGFKDPDPLPGEEGKAAVAMIYDMFEPGIMGSARRLAHRAGDPMETGLSPFVEPLTSRAQIATRFTPFGLEPVGRHSMAGEVARINAEKARLQKARTEVRGKRRALTEQERQALIREIEARQAEVVSQADRKSAAKPKR